MNEKDKVASPQRELGETPLDSSLTACSQKSSGETLSNNEFWKEPLKRESLDDGSSYDMDGEKYWQPEKEMNE